MYLGLHAEELNEYEEREPKSLRRRLLRLLVDWERSEQRATVGGLVSACVAAGIGDAVKRELRGTHFRGYLNVKDCNQKFINFQ